MAGISGEVSRVKMPRQRRDMGIHNSVNPILCKMFVL